MIDTTAITNALKYYYRKGTSVVTYDAKHRPLFTELKKNEEFAGKGMPIPVIWAESGSRSATFATAQTNSEGGEIAEFMIDVVEDHGVSQMTNKALKRARNDLGAFLKGQKLLVDGIMRQMANALESSLFRTSSGNIGTVDANGVTSHVFTLDDIDDIVNFYVGQHIVAAASVTSSLRTNAAEVTALDLDTGEITMSLTPTSMAAGDVIFNEGDYVSSSDTLKVSGLADWIPATAPTGGDDFFGQDRSADPGRLAGRRATGSLSDIEGSIIDALSSTGRDTPVPQDTAWMSFSTFRKLTKQMGVQVQRAPGGTAKGGYRYIEIDGPKGTVKCRPAPFCQPNIVWLLAMETWELVSMGEAITLDDVDGMKMQRVSNASAQEVRIFSFPQLACDKPGANARLTLS